MIDTSHCSTQVKRFKHLLSVYVVFLNLSDHLLLCKLWGSAGWHVCFFYLIGKVDNLIQNEFSAVNVYEKTHFCCFVWCASEWQQTPASNSFLVASVQCVICVGLHWCLLPSVFTGLNKCNYRLVVLGMFEQSGMIFQQNFAMTMRYYHLPTPKQKCADSTAIVKQRQSWLTVHLLYFFFFKDRKK